MAVKVVGPTARKLRIKFRDVSAGGEPYYVIQQRVALFFWKSASDFLLLEEAKKRAQKALEETA